MTELIIDETNFDQYFFDVHKHRPKKGQVMACYEAVAEFVDGDLKRDLVNSLLFKNNTEAAIRTFQKFGFTSYKESFKVVKNIVNDLLNGLDIFEILAKPYEYPLQMMYYTQKEYIPENDLHWSTIKLLESSYIDMSDSTDSDTIRNNNELSK